jgi:hypothetical protein
MESGSLAHGIGTGDFTIGIRALWNAKTAYAPVYGNGANNGSLFLTWAAQTEAWGFLGMSGSQFFTTVLATATQYALVVRRSGSTISGWVNGVQDATTFTGGGSMANAAQRIGDSGTNDFVDATLADWFLSNVAWTEDEIGAYADGFSPLLIRRGVKAWAPMVRIPPSSSTGNVLAGTGENNAGIGATAWADPANVTADDAADSICAAAASSQYLVARNCGFAIPTDSSIWGITVRIEASEHSGGTESLNAQLQNDVGTLVGSAKANTISGTGKAVYTYGSASDVWGASLTPAIVNDADFGVRFWFTTAHDVRADFVTIAVEYGPAAIDPIGGLTFGKRNTGVLTTEVHPKVIMHARARLSFPEAAAAAVDRIHEYTDHGRLNVEAPVAVGY